MAHLIDILRYEKNSALFYAIGQVSTPIFTNEIPTACVSIGLDGKPIFKFNKTYWANLTDTEKEFVVCHESVHLMLNHLLRVSKIQEKSNIAADLVTNHLLVDEYRFNRADLSFEKDICFVDTVFKKQDVPSGQSMEYYDRILSDNVKHLQLDVHQPMTEAQAEKFKEALGETIGKLSEEEQEKIKRELETLDKLAGSDPGETTVKVTKSKVKKKKWETVIKHNLSKLMTKEDYFWIKNRRWSMIPDNLMLPSNVPRDPLKDKIDVWFFLDTSGSCADLADRFFKAATSLPECFVVKLMCFDTKVYTVKDGQLKGFGGTRFDIIETRLRQEETRTGKYPKAVFIITDGAGNKVEPKHPERWYWFLSTKFTRFVPTKSKIYMLSDYE